MMRRIRMTGLALVALAGCWCLAGQADDTDAKRGNLLPVEYAGDNVGGFLGWETGGANVRLLSERGPDGGKVLRFTDSGGTFSFTHAKRRLAPGGRYRLTANVRARNLNGPKRFELMLHNWPWSQEMTANVPRETDGRWEPASWEGVLPPSENDAYDCTVYCSGPLAEDAFFDLADLRLEAVDEKAASGASPIPSSAPYRARICPVDPPLAEIDPRQAKMRFYYGGPVADANGRVCRLRARLGASVREVPLGASHQASVDFGPVAPGRHPLVAEILGPEGEHVTASNDYVAIVRPVIGNPTPLKRLNNLAWEICAKPLADGETTFTLAKAGWVYVGTDRPYETVVCDVDESFRGVVRHRPHEPNGSTRFLEAGEHVVRTRGVPEDAKGTLYVRLVKPITVGGFANALAGKYMTCVRDEAYFERCGLLGTINFTNTRIGMSDSVRAKFADRGVEILGDVSCAAWLPVRDDLPALVRHFTNHEYFRKGIPFTIDENGVNVAVLKKYNAAEAMWEVYRSGLRMDVFLEDGYRGRFNRPGLDYPDLSAYVNVGEGRSFMCSECYWRSPVDEEEMAATVDFMRRQIREMRALVPSAPSHLVYYLNGFMQIGSWTSWIYPHVDMKAFDAKILHLLATDPEFADIGGVGCAGMYCAEEYLRSMYAAFQHYVLEGRTDDFCALHGYSVFPGHLRNGDFDEGWDGWTVRSAEEGSLRLGHKKGLGGPAYQQRRCWWFKNGTYAVGENYALFTANGRKPNALLQKITGLRPGELYQITYVTMNPTNAARPVLWAKVKGAEDIPELRHVCTCTGGKTKAPVTSTRLVFRATDTTATLAFSDWLAKDYVPAEGAQCMLNYIGCHRYFVRDEEELEFLRTHFARVTKGSAPALPLPAGVAVSSYSIEGPKDAAAVWENTAASELKGYLGRMVTDGRLTVGGADGVVFHVGDTEFAKGKGLGSSAFKDEEWCVKSFGRDVVLNGGGTRGCLYAVYHFLEDECGVCWWNDDDEDVPEAAGLALPALDRRGKPFFRYRDIYRDRRSSPAFAVRCRVNGNGVSWIPPELGGGFVYGPPYHTHTWDRYLPFEKYGREHPEWYSFRKKENRRVGGQEKGQLCLTCPGLVDVLAAEVEKSIAKGEAEAKAKGLPPPRIYDLTMNDNSIFCECDRCREETERYGHSGRQLRFVNAVAAKVGAGHPELLFSTAAYLHSEPTPKGGVRAADNVVVKLCNTKQNMGAGIGHADNAFMHDLVRDWGNHTRELFVWEYAITYVKATTGFPFPSEFHIADKYRYYADCGVSGFLLEHEQTDRADMFELKFYLERKVLEDPYQDAGALTDGFYRRYFGAAAPKVRAARDCLRKAYDGRKAFVTWFPQFGEFNWIGEADIARAKALFDGALADVRGDAKRERRVKRARMSLDSIADCREKALKPCPPEKGVSDREFYDFMTDRRYWLLYRHSDATIVDDATAANGKAVRLPANSDRGFRFPVQFGLADPRAKKSARSAEIAALKGEGWHWYELGNVTFPEGDAYAYFTWFIQVHFTAPELVGRTLNIKVHARFTDEAAYVDRFIFEKVD